MRVHVHWFRKVQPSDIWRGDLAVMAATGKVPYECRCGKRVAR